ncbi:TetR/AcrR family transcriptional regulator [Sneathiella marina]|uniref:TetR/AcrR family transcriptional regulator n=1 Tax=Sneathiella marina TaxID=2950108 RepID=A0ABY4W6W6_9PROT|nr:TetR/AcrR family transcriptional regulator [Sneathiella marina]USG62931.1 TetR/AcrR family transcriptional regulator [Sneathiella marina]
MQEKKKRMTNAERTLAMRVNLLDVARRLFSEKGYGATSTPEIVAAAKVTRGALYHHFEDKLALFRAVVEREAERVADAIQEEDSAGDDILNTLKIGSEAYFKAMQEPGRSHLLLVEGPAVLGLREMNNIMAARDGEQLRLGLQGLLQHDPNLPLDALSDVLAAAFDRAAYAVAEGRAEEKYRQALDSILTAIYRNASK